MRTTTVMVALLRVVAGGAACRNGTEPFVTVLTTLPFVRPAKAESVRARHFFETLLALGQNTAFPSVAEVHVVVDAVDAPRSDNNSTSRDEDDSEATELLREATRRLTGATVALWKLTAHVWGRQPTYADMLRYASTRFAGHFVALTNADVVLPNLYRLDRAAFRSQRLAFTLAVRPPAKNRTCRTPTMCLVNQGSWDVHLFESPLPSDAQWHFLEELQPGPIFMNQMGAENRVGIFLHASGYELRNPCHDLVAEHWHCSPKTHHSELPVWDWIKTPHLHLPGYVVDPEPPLLGGSPLSYKKYPGAPSSSGQQHHVPGLLPLDVFCDDDDHSSL